MRWSLRLKNEFVMDEVNPGYAGIGIVCTGFMYECTKDGFQKMEIISRLKQLKEKHSIIAVQKWSGII